MELQRSQPSHSNFPLVPALPPTRIASGFCLCVSKTEIIIVFSLWGWIYLMRIYIESLEGIFLIEVYLMYNIIYATSVQHSNPQFLKIILYL